MRGRGSSIYLTSPNPPDRGERSGFGIEEWVGLEGWRAGPLLTFNIPLACQYDTSPEDSFTSQHLAPLVQEPYPDRRELEGRRVIGTY